MTPSRSSGDLLADRRYAYAEGLLLEGEVAAAVDLFEQTVALAPHWAPAWVALGAARERQGDIPAALRDYCRAASLDPTGLYGAGLHVARLTGEVAPAMPAAYVAALFDDYAPRFDRHLVDGLSYRGPALLRDALGRASPGRRFARAIDLGCGTGLMGVAIRPLVDHLAGLDLSPAMVAAARRRGLYDRLAVGEIHAALAEEPAASCDLLLAADVFTYIGAIEATLCAAARVLQPDGLVAFTVQRGTAAWPTLGPDMRFAHSAAVVTEAVAAGGLAPSLLIEASTRRDAGADVPGLVVVARKP